VITAVEGVRVGHSTDHQGRTGCTAVLLPAGTVASGEVRGGAPGTREWALLDPRRRVDRVDAVVLTGGSAPGLAACDGVSRWCAERGIGWATSAGPVPIVVGLVLFDLGVGDPEARPGPEAGYAACTAARAGLSAVGHGLVGAGAGATIAKWQGPDRARPGGLGSASISHDGVTVAALVVANSLGEPGRDPTGPRIPLARSPVVPAENTTIGVVVTDARLDKWGCLALAEAAHDGLARAVDPVHTAADGDAFVVAATGGASAPASPDLPALRAMSTWVVEQAVLAACGAAPAPP
jgi:L-aminopeptidase/D-esterase-like protein